MSYANTRGRNGRRHRVDFGESPVRVENEVDEEEELYLENPTEAAERMQRFTIIKELLTANRLGTS